MLPSAIAAIAKKAIAWISWLNSCQEKSQKGSQNEAKMTTTLDHPEIKKSTPLLPNRPAGEYKSHFQ
jgi:hypothetical protein